MQTILHVSHILSRPKFVTDFSAHSTVAQIFGESNRICLYLLIIKDECSRFAILAQWFSGKVTKKTKNPFLSIPTTHLHLTNKPDNQRPY